MSDLREQIADVLDEHRIEAFGLGEVSCVCEHEWRSDRWYRDHVAEKIIDELGLTVEERIDEPGKRGINPVRRIVGKWEKES